MKVLLLVLLGLVIGSGTTNAQAAALEPISLHDAESAYALMTMEEGKQSIEKHCSDRWPTDFQMLAWCIDREEEALVWFQTSLPKMSLLEQAIRNECLHEWSEESKGTSWTMGKWCYEREMKAWQSLADNPSTAERAKQLGLARLRTH